MNKNPKPKPSLPHLKQRNTKIKRTHSHETKLKTIDSNTTPLFHQIQHDINAYIQRFLFNCSKKYFYCNEYSLTRDMIACNPLTYQELMDIHKKSYIEVFFNDAIRVSHKKYQYMIDAKIGASVDRNSRTTKVYNGIYGILQTFVDKNNHISYIFCDKLVHDCYASIDLLQIVKEDIPWKEYSARLLKELEGQLLGPYKSFALDKFKKLLHKEQQTLSLILFVSKRGVCVTETKNSHRKRELISLLQGTITTEEKESLGTLYQELKTELDCDAAAIEFNIQKHLKKGDIDIDRDCEKSKNIKLIIEGLPPMAAREKALNLMLKIDSTDQRSIELKGVYQKTHKFVQYCAHFLEHKYECLRFNETLIKLKKEFHGKNKRFKKEIKDRITAIKEIDLTRDMINKSSKIASIIRFSKQNAKLLILSSMINNIKSMCVPSLAMEGVEGEEKEIEIDFARIYECDTRHKSIVAELEKQKALCDKLLSKLQDYALKKQRKLLSRSDSESESESDNHNPDCICDNVIFRDNNTGAYVKRFLIVIWKTKIYKVYASQIAFTNHFDKPLLSNHFRATDYGYNGQVSIDVKRSSKSKKTSKYNGYQFILHKHAFVVKDMLDIKYWRNFIQRGENIRKASQDWDKSYLRNDENKSYLNRRSRYIRKTRSSSLI